MDRACNYTKQTSITVEAENTFKSAFNLNTVQGEVPGSTPEIPGLTISGLGVEDPVLTLSPPENIQPTEKFINEVKSDAKSKVLVHENQNILDHVNTLIKQGHFLKLTKLEQTDATWKSFIYNLPRSTMKWALNSSIDTLPTKVNLKLWGKRVNDKCFCGQRQTLNHVLNCCNQSLDQGRYTARHDSILNFISQCLDSKKYKCFIDLEGHQTQSGGTIPPSILVTTLKPDIVIVDRQAKTVKIFELTVPGETRLEVAHRLKYEKYQHFVSDIKSHTASVIPFEIGSNTGLINRENRKSLHTLHSFCKKDVKFKKFVQNISAISILSSYYIFNCRNQEGWAPPGHILAPFSNQ